VNAVFAADAVGRLSGKPGVCAVTAGPGVTNTVTALKNAQMAESPVVLLGGAAATVMQGRGALQDIDQMAVVASLCKWTYSCRSARDIVPALRSAFQRAASGVPGAVALPPPQSATPPPASSPIADSSSSAVLRRRLRAGPVFVELPLDVLYPVTELYPQAGCAHLPRACLPCPAPPSSPPSSEH
jgi:thiamine pyrophosphate-dependent acetolactate synthase large subunit-like protein